MLGFDLAHTTRLARETGGTWSRYAPADHDRPWPLDHGGMTDKSRELESSWARTRGHLAAAMSCLVEATTADLSGVQEWIDHNELSLAFDDLVDLGDDRELPLAFWFHLDRAAREMRLHSAALGMPHLTSADLCRRHLAAASEASDE